VSFVLKQKAPKLQAQEIYINLKQIVHSQNLRSPLFRLDWCGTHLISQPTDFHSSRRSGGIYSLLFIVF
jgi:hypothetical protein